MSQASDGLRSEGVIRISAEDAASAHVDDLLRRQASLRGERGITARRKRKWYYRNWFVFMIAGLVGALAAWGLIEPHFRDLPYYQGKIAEIDVDGYPRPFIEIGGAQLCLEHAEFAGRLRINDETVYLLSTTQQVRGGRGAGPLDPGGLKAGQEIGVYVNRADDIEDIENPPTNLDQRSRDRRGRGQREGGAWVLRVEKPRYALFVDPSPPARAEAMGTLKQEEVAHHIVGLLLFPAVAGAVGLCIGAADGVICRLLRRALLAGTVGLLIGVIGGFVFQLVAGLVYLPLTHLAQQTTGPGGHFTTLGFLTQMSGRGLAWCLTGVAMGLGQGIALRSGRLLLYGLLGGAIGGLLGGLLFDPIDLLLLGQDKVSAFWSRMVGVGVIGATVGAMIGVVELLARDAWLQMLEGPLSGKEFLIFKDLLYVGASPRSDIYLFNDKQVAPRHAIVRSVADHYEIEAADHAFPLLVNGRPIERARLRHGDQITLGKTVFSFQRRRPE